MALEGLPLERGVKVSIDSPPRFSQKLL